MGTILCNLKSLEHFQYNDQYVKLMSLLYLFMLCLRIMSIPYRAECISNKSQEVSGHQGVHRLHL